MKESNGMDNYDVENDERQAFVLRISLRGFDIENALEADQIAIGWSSARGLTNKGLSREEFRQIVSDEYYRNEENMRKAGLAAGKLWKFIRDMNDGDLVVVPCGPDFFVAKVIGPPTYDESKIDGDAAYRRDVNWLNDKNSFLRTSAEPALMLRMKTRGACVSASDLLPQIEECI